MKIINKALFFLFLIIGTFYKAGEILNESPEPPSPPGGGGGTGPGALASPIDMYVYILAIAAILFIVLYAKRIHQKQTL